MVTSRFTLNSEWYLLGTLYFWPCVKTKLSLINNFMCTNNLRLLRNIYPKKCVHIMMYVFVYIEILGGL